MEVKTFWLQKEHMQEQHFGLSKQDWHTCNSYRWRFLLKVYENRSCHFGLISYRIDHGKELKQISQHKARP
jgi:hypothetical protein